MTRYMADSVECREITPTVLVPGRGVQPVSLRVGYATSSRYHTSSTKCGNTDVLVDVNATVPVSDVLDIEAGDATPAQAPGWVHAHNAVCSFPAILYCNRSTLTAVANACSNAGLEPGRDFYWWIATLDGTTSVKDMTGVVAVQVWGANYFPGHNIDLSIVYDDAWKAGPVTDTVDPAKINQIAQDTAEIRRMLGVILGWQPPAKLPDGSPENVLNTVAKRPGA